MPGGGITTLVAATDIDRVEAPVTLKGYLMCAFAAFGGIFFGFDSGYTSGILGMKYFIHTFTGQPYPTADSTPEELRLFVIPASRQSLIVSILSAGTFFGSIAAGEIADVVGRRWTIIAGCAIFCVGVAFQVASTAYGLLVAGRFVAGIGVGFVSAVIILYMSEIAPRKVRGAIVSAYQWCITVGILLASCVTYGTQNMMTSGSYRIPMALQWVWALILAVGLAVLPESPRYHVKRGNLDEASSCLARLRGQPKNSEFIQQELSEIVAHYEFELRAIGQDTGYIRSWLNCFSGSITDPSSNLRRTVVGTTAQMMQQFTGINFIFYYGTVFFQSLGTISNPFLISLTMSLVIVFATAISFYTMDRFGRRKLLIYGGLGTVVSQFIVAIAGTVSGSNETVVKVMIVFICFYILSFGCTWGPAPWVVVGEMFPLSIRSRGVALSVASNWFWNCIISVITPYMLSPDEGDLGPKVFFIWGALCIGCTLWAYFLVYETKGLTLEQVDKMLHETTPRKSAAWKPTTTFAAEMGIDDKGQLSAELVEDVQRHGHRH